MAIVKGAARINRPRNRFKMNHDLGTTFDGGLVIPLHWYEILPGDTAEVKVSYIVRQLAQLNPVMSNAWLKIDAFFIPLETIWTKAKQFFGQQDPSTWSIDAYTIPAFKSSDLINTSEHDLGDYLGLPIGRMANDQTYPITALPLRAYLKTWNYWYRSEFVVSEILFPTDGGTAGTWENLNNYGRDYNQPPLPSMKLPDYFTSAMPQTSRITPIELAGRAPVRAGVEHDAQAAGTHYPLKGQSINAGGAVVGPNDIRVVMASTSGGALTGNTTSGSYNFSPTNLWADNASLTVETFRRAVVFQHIGEIMERAGSRYASEFLPNIFGVENSESMYDEPEYLGGFEQLINMQEVYSQADTGSTGRPIGDNGGLSKTTGKDYLFQHTFSRHGVCLICATVRHEECYGEGYERKWTKSSFWDFYLPQAQGLGYQKIMTRELYGQANRDQVFGYQDYGAEYRFTPSRLSGYMRPYLSGSLSSWTWSQTFSAAPVLNTNFMNADSSGFTRTQAVSGVAQFLGNFHFEGIWTRVVGVQRFPGLTRI